MLVLWGRIARNESQSHRYENGTLECDRATMWTSAAFLFLFESKSEYETTPESESVENFWSLFFEYLFMLGFFLFLFFFGVIT